MSYEKQKMMMPKSDVPKMVKILDRLKLWHGSDGDAAKAVGYNRNITSDARSKDRLSSDNARLIMAEYQRVVAIND